MAGRARHLPRRLHRDLLAAILHQPSWFTADEVLVRLGPTVQRFRRREVATLLMLLARHQLLTVEGLNPRRFRRPVRDGWRLACEVALDPAACRQPAEEVS